MAFSFSTFKKVIVTYTDGKEDVFPETGNNSSEYKTFSNHQSGGACIVQNKDDGFVIPFNNVKKFRIDGRL
jgi:hypothetical protein